MCDWLKKLQYESADARRGPWRGGFPTVADGKVVEHPADRRIGPVRDGLRRRLSDDPPDGQAGRGPVRRVPAGPHPVAPVPDDPAVRGGRTRRTSPPHSGRSWSGRSDPSAAGGNLRTDHTAWAVVAVRAVLPGRGRSMTECARCAARVRPYNVPTPEVTRPPDPARVDGLSPSMTTETRPSPRPRCRRLMGVRVAGTGQLRPRRRRHQRPPAPAARLRLRLDRQADRHPRAPPRPAAPGHQRPVPSRRRSGLHRQGRGRARRTSTCSSSAPSRRTCRSRRRRAWCRTGSGSSAPAIEVEAACAGFMYALITGGRLRRLPGRATWPSSSAATATRASSTRTTSRPTRSSATGPGRCS